jgi:hypothetical protein
MPSWKSGPGLAVPGDAEVAGGDAAHGAVVRVQHLGRGKPGKISTPSASACCASQRTTLPRLMT